MIATGITDMATLFPDQSISRTQVRQTIRDDAGEPLYVTKEVSQLIVHISAAYPDGIETEINGVVYRLSATPKRKDNTNG